MNASVGWWRSTAARKLARSSSSGPMSLTSDFSHAFGAPVGGRTAAGRLALKKSGIFLQIGGRTPRAVALKAGNAVLDVGGVADLAHFAVADHVHTGLALLRHDRIHCFGQQGMARRRLHPLALFLCEHHVRDRLGTRQAAYMRSENAFRRLLHDKVLLRPFRRRSGAGGCRPVPCARQSLPARRAASNTRRSPRKPPR